MDSKTYHSSRFLIFQVLFSCILSNFVVSANAESWTTISKWPEINGCVFLENSSNHHRPVSLMYSCPSINNELYTIKLSKTFVMRKNALSMAVKCGKEAIRFEGNTMQIRDFGLFVGDNRNLLLSETWTSFAISFQGCQEVTSKIINTVIKSIEDSGLSLRYIHFSNTTLNLSETLDSINHLSMMHTHFDRSTSESFGKLPHLQDLTMKNNYLRETELSTVLHLPFLRTLYLENNTIEATGSETFKNVKNLTELILHERHLSLLAPGVFEFNKRLESLSLLSDQLLRIENETFRGLENLKKLYLNSKSLELIDVDAFEFTKKLRYINLSEVPFKAMTQLRFIHNSTWHCEEPKLVEIRKPDFDDQEKNDSPSPGMDSLKLC